MLGGINNWNAESIQPYTYFNLVPAAQAGVSVPATLSVTVGQFGGTVAAWIDWNRNDQFSTDEKLGTGDYAVSANGTASIAFVPPASAQPGLSRLRVRFRGTGTSSMDPCGTMIGAGETEDYNITISNAAVSTVVSAGAALAGWGIPSSGKMLLASLDIMASNGPATISGLTFAASGSLMPVHVGSLELWRDTDASGDVGTADQLLGSVASFTGNTVTFAAAPLVTLTANGVARLLVRETLLASAPAGASLTLAVESTGSVSSSLSPVQGGFPVNAGNISVRASNPAPYSANFEAGDGAQEGWSLSGANAGLWQWGTVPTGSSNPGARSGTKAWSTSLNGTVSAPGATAMLDSAAISLAGLTDPELQFWLYLGITAGALAATVSRNGGPWLALPSSDPAWRQSAPNQPSSALFTPPIDAWTSAQAAMTPPYVRVRLGLKDSLVPGLAGLGADDAIRVRFWYQATTVTTAVRRAYVDDFKIAETNRAPTLSVNALGQSLAHLSTLSVPWNSSVAAAQIAVSASDPDGDLITVDAEMVWAHPQTGIVIGEWERLTPAQSHVLVPTSGHFRVAFGGAVNSMMKFTCQDGETSTVVQVWLQNPTPPPALTAAVGGASMTIPSFGSPTGQFRVDVNFPAGLLLGTLNLGFSHSPSSRIIVTGSQILPGQPVGTILTANSGQSTLSANLSVPNALHSLSSPVSFLVNVIPDPSLVTSGPVAVTLTGIAGYFPNGPVNGTQMNLSLQSSPSNSGSLAISTTPPQLSARWGPVSIQNNAIVSVPYRSLLSDLGLHITVGDQAWEPLTLTGQISALTNQGILPAQFSATGTAGAISLSPVAGQFTVPSVSHVVSLMATDGVASSTLSFTLAVGPSQPPVIRVASNGGNISHGSVSTVDSGTTLASLGLTVTATDPDGGAVSLTAAISNNVTQALVPGEFSSPQAVVPYTVSPASGQFGPPGAFHVITLTATDEAGVISTFQFTVRARVNTPPSATASTVFGPLPPFGVVNVRYATSLQDLDLRIWVDDNEEDDVSVSVAFVGTPPDGGAPSEFEATDVPAGTLIRPQSGIFRAPGQQLTVILSLTDGLGTASFRFSIATGPNTPPSIEAQAAGAVFSPTHLLNVPYGASLASLGLTFAVRDPDATPVALAANIANAASIQSLSLTEWSSAPRDGPYTKSPLSGFFTAPDTTHTVTLTADDGDGGVTTFGFTIAVGSNAEPVLSVTSNGQPALAAYGLSPGANVASLGLTASASNPDPYERLTLSLVLSGDPVPGLSDASFGSLTGAASLAVPAAMLLADNAVHALTFSAADQGGNVQSRTVTIFVGSDVRLSIAVLPASTVGQQYSAKLAAVLGTPPYAFSSPNLPEWLNLESATGILSGMPPRGTATGTVNLTFSVTDSGPLEPSMDKVALPLRIEAPVPVDIVLLPPGDLTQPANPVPILFVDVNGMRNRVTEVDLPFPVTYFGTTYQSLWVSTNGWVSFNDPDGNSFPSNSRVTSPAGPLNAVFLFWDQLEFTAASSITIGSATANGTTAASPPVTNAGELVVIAYTNLAAFGQPGTSMSGQIVFDTGNGDVRLEYPQTGQNWTNATATIGMRGPYPGQSADPFNLGAQASNPPTSGVAFAVPSVATLVTQSIRGATQYAAYQTALVAHGGPAPYTWTLDSAPSWLSISSSTGVLSGTPGDADTGSYPIAVTVTDFGGSSASSAFTLTIAPGSAPSAPTGAASDSGCTLRSGHGGLFLSLLALLAFAATVTRRWRET